MLHSCYGINDKGHFTIGGADTVLLAQKYKTPLYVLDEQTVRENCRVYISAMNKYFKSGSTIHYASKALSFKGIYRIMREEGVNVDLCSLGEIYTAKSAGFDLSKACFHGNNKTDENIRLAIREGIGEFVVDSFEELEALERIAGEEGIVQNAFVRITPNIDCHTLKAISTGQLDSKFGTPIETGQAELLVHRALELKNVRLIGYHCHCGSQVFETQPYVNQTEIMFAFAADIMKKTGYAPEYMNLGGGFGVRYTENDPQIDIAENIRLIAEKEKEICDRFDLPEPKILMEPGRSVVANAGVTLYTVGTVKHIEGYRTYVSVDGGMTDNPRYALYGSKYEVLLANKASQDKDATVTVAGCCCESGDLIGENMKLQKAKRGDILAVTVTGAYNYSMASNYNRVPRPALVIVNNGQDRLGIKRETYEDLFRNDI